MPLYDFQYVTKDGVTKVVERRMNMSAMTPEIDVVDEDGSTYRAKNVITRPHAKMANKWKVRGTDSYLPPENARMVEQGDGYRGGE